MKARDVMTRAVISIRPDGSILEAARLMLDNRISGLPVVDDAGRLIGIVTERDLLRLDAADRTLPPPEWLEVLITPARLARNHTEWSTRTVSEVMTRDPVTITEDSPIETALRLMARHGIKRLPVMRGDHLVGVIARPDLVRAFAEGLVRPPGEDAARRARMVELEKQFWTHRTKPSG